MVPLQLMLLFWETLETVGGGVSLEEVSTGVGWVSCLSPVLVSPCYLSAVR